MGKVVRGAVPEHEELNAAATVEHGCGTTRFDL